MRIDELKLYKYEIKLQKKYTYYEEQDNVRKPMNTFKKIIKITKGVLFVYNLCLTFLEFPILGNAILISPFLICNIT